MPAYRAGLVGLTGIAASPIATPPSPVLGTVHGGSHAAAYARHPEVEVVGACDLMPERCEEFVQRWGDTWPHLETYSDYRAMLKAGKLDLLSVVTSDHRHTQIVVDAAEAGVKGIYCEKPFATTLADIDRMVEACQKHNMVISVDHTRRWRPLWHQVRALLRSGQLGPLRRVVAYLGGPRAMIFRNGTHLLDMICFFAESEPAWVMGELDDEHKDYPPRYAGDGGRDPATDPGGSAYIHFENGVRAFVTASKTEQSLFGMTLYCEKGYVTVEDNGAEVCQPGAEGARQHMRWRLHAGAVARSALEAGVAELIEHVAARQRGEEPPAPLVSPPEAGRRVLGILLGILQSNHAGSAKVTFPVSDA